MDGRGAACCSIKQVVGRSLIVVPVCHLNRVMSCGNANDVHTARLTEPGLGRYNRSRAIQSLALQSHECAVTHRIGLRRINVNMQSSDRLQRDICNELLAYVEVDDWQSLRFRDSRVESWRIRDIERRLALAVVIITGRETSATVGPAHTA